MNGQYTDKTLQCLDCGTEFVFSASEQERFAELGFTNEPKRCFPCRAARKKAGGGSGVNRAGGSDRSMGSKEMHVTKCTNCGGEARVPFKPRGDRPVYCSSCFTSNRS